MSRDYKVTIIRTWPSTGSTLTMFRGVDSRDADAHCSDVNKRFAAGEIDYYDEGFTE